MKKLLYIILLFLFGCQNKDAHIISKKIEWEESKIKIFGPPITGVDVFTIKMNCKSLSIHGSLFITDKDTIDYSGEVAYIPCDCDNPESCDSYDINDLIIIDTLGFYKTMMSKEKIDKYIKQKELTKNL